MAFILLQNQLAGGGEWLLFSEPREQIIANKPEDVHACLEKIKQRQQQGYYLAGYLAYEAAGGLNSAMPAFDGLDYPLVCFGVYEKPKVVTLDDVSTQTPFDNRLCWQPDISLEAYTNALDKIKAAIAAGDTYQVNYTFRMQSKFVGDSLAFFHQLQGAQFAKYSAYIDIGSKQICSASPELFFTLQAGKLQSKPMKGTVSRGLHKLQDLQREKWLYTSEKNRAENVMIVDMIRNDLGLVAETGTVDVESLFDIETYPTVFQMTSSVSATTDLDAVDVLKAMFPCASITGAPKINTMKIIQALEHSTRGIYSGSIGYITPEGDAQFNVAIRTVVIDKKNNTASYGVGGGIVWDSTVDDEYAECKIKAEILTRAPPSLSLLESMRVDDKGNILLLEAHLQRLKDSCKYFGFPFNEAAIGNYLNRAIQQAGCGRSLKLRLLVNESGEVDVETAALETKVGQKVVLASRGVNTQSRFIYHKTTNRKFYTDLLAHYEADDVIIVNSEGYVTETCFANIVIKQDGKLLTPSFDCGLLNGTLRQHLLTKGEIIEARIKPTQLDDADAVYLINSVRGWMTLSPMNESLFTVSKESF